MPNPYFNNQRTFIPNTLVKSDEVNSQFNDVENGFDLIDEKVTQVETLANDSVTAVNTAVTEVVQLVEQVQEIIDSGAGDQPGTVPGAPVLIPFNQAIPFDGNYIMQTTDADIPLNFSIDFSKPPLIGAKVRLTMVGRGRFDEVVFSGIDLLANPYNEPFNHNWGVRNLLTFEFDGTNYICRIEKGVKDTGETYASSDPSYVIFSERQGFYSAPANRFFFYLHSKFFPDTPIGAQPYLEGASYEWPLSKAERYAMSKNDNKSVALRNGRNAARARFCWATGSQLSLTQNSSFEFRVSVFGAQTNVESYGIVFSKGQFDQYIFTPDGTNPDRERVYIAGGHDFDYFANYTGDASFNDFIYRVFWEFAQTSDAGVQTSRFLDNFYDSCVGIYRPNSGNAICYRKNIFTGVIENQQTLGQITSDLWPHIYFTALQGNGNGNVPSSEATEDGGFQFIRKISGPPSGLII